jgi:predicted transposase YbfD/YdcC
MSLVILESLPTSRVKALLDHFGEIDDPRDPWRVAYPLDEVLLLVVCGTICDCDDYEAIAAWGAAHLPLLRRHRPFHHGVPGGRWLTLLMNRIDPGLFAQVFTDWVRATWPGRPDLVAIDGKTSRRSHDRAAGTPPLHLVSAFATTSRLVLGQEAVPDKASETTAIPVLIARLAEGGGLEGALVSIDAIATQPAIAAAILDAGAHYLLAVKANQPSLRHEVEALFAQAAPGALDVHQDVDKGHGRIEQRHVSVAREVDWLDGGRRFPGEPRLPQAACLVRVSSRTEMKDRCRFDTRFYVSSASLTAQRAATAIRGHWGIENSLHWVLDVVFADDQSRLRKGHGAKTMAIIRHFAINLVRSAPNPPRPEPLKPQRRPKPGAIPRPMSLKLRRKVASWDPAYLATVIAAEES